MNINLKIAVALATLVIGVNSANAGPLKEAVGDVAGSAFSVGNKAVKVGKKVALKGAVVGFVAAAKTERLVRRAARKTAGVLGRI